LKIEKHIIQLIKEDNRVVIPGLGTFMSKANAVNIKSSTKTITPPDSEIRFTDLLKNSNKRLAEYIAEKESVSFEEANTAVEDFVKQAKEELNTNKKFTITGFGELSYSKGNMLIFEHANIINTESFGLKEVELPKKISKATPTPEVKKAMIKEPKATSPKKQKEVKSTEKSSKLALLGWVAFIVVILSFVAYFASFHFELGNNVRNKIVSLFKTEEIIVETPQITETVAPVETKTVIEEPTFTYHVIAGSFTNKNNANKLAKKLDKEGFITKVLGPDNNRYKVSFASYPIKKEAIDAAEFYKQKKGKKNCWVYAQKN